MIPTSVSASALETAEHCLAMYKASSIQRANGFQNNAAQLGTALHGALEKYVDPIMMKSGMWDWVFLKLCYEVSYQEVFGTNRERYDDGLVILEGWYNRSDQQSDIQSVEILSREVKKSFDVPYMLNGQEQKVPCNYIMDRIDRLGEGRFRVVDYKSQLASLSPEVMRHKIQPRIYALAIQIEYPSATEIWVQYDFLRYERVATRFTRDDNIETWRWLKRAVQRIIDTPEENPPETLNEHCKYCVRRFQCSTLQNNISVGGIYSLSVDQMAILYHDLASRESAIKSMKDDLEIQLLKYANEKQEMDFPLGEDLNVSVTSKKRRYIDRDKMAQILGPEIIKDYGKVNVSELDEIRKDPRLTNEQKSLLNTAVFYKHSDPGIKVIRKTFK